MILMYLYAVLGLFQKTRSMIEERSSPFIDLVIASPERKEGTEKSAFYPSARTWRFRACAISAAVMGELPRIGARASASREMLENRYPRVISQPMTDSKAVRCSTAATGHVAKHA